jgi:hypothetical protein
MKLLSTMAAIRLEGGSDNIVNTLTLALVDAARPGTIDRSIQSSNPFASSLLETGSCVLHVKFRSLVKQHTVLT